MPCRRAQDVRPAKSWLAGPALGGAEGASHHVRTAQGPTRCTRSTRRTLAAGGSFDPIRLKLLRRARRISKCAPESAFGCVFGCALRSLRSGLDHGGRPPGAASPCGSFGAAANFAQLSTRRPEAPPPVEGEKKGESRGKKQRRQARSLVTQPRRASVCGV